MSLAITSFLIAYPAGAISTPSNTGLSEAKISDILSNLMTWLLGIAGIIALIAFVISGIQYLTAAGSDTQMEAAKRNLLYSIIGVIVASAGMVIIKAIDTFLRG